MATDHSWRVVFNPGAADDFFQTHRPDLFDSHAVGFSRVNAWWLSEFSRLIYRRDETEGVATIASRSAFLARVGLVERRFFYHPHAQAALVETLAGNDRAFAALVFRGTAGSISNWRFNLNMAPCAWPSGGKVHRGFGQLILTVWDTIAAALQTVDTPLFFTGHSLGGALATLAASLHAPQAVYTFGAPRIGDAAFARGMSRVPVFNVFNPHDIVTQLPPAGIRARYVHVGDIVRNSDSRPSHRLFGQTPAFLADHAPFNYTAQLPLTCGNR